MVYVIEKLIWHFTHFFARRLSDFAPSRGNSLLPTLWLITYVSGYELMLLWFKRVDVYHRHFSDSGGLVFANNAFRVLFIFYLFSILYASGRYALQRVMPRSKSDFSTAEQVALGFFTGAGVWQAIIFLLGFLNLLKVWAVVALTLPVLVLSFKDMYEVLSRSPGILTTAVGFTHFKTHERAKAILRGAVILTAAAMAAALLLVKGLYPSGGHDYFNHYFAYYKAVIDRGNLWPNDVWYHFYYSKGADLFYLAMLLTDPLAPQLVTYCCIIGSALALWLLVRRIAPGTLWPWGVIILYLGLYIYTPGPAINRANGGWGDFEKLHELNAAFVIAIIWMLAGALERAGRSQLPWILGAGSTITAAIILNPSITVFLGALLAMLTAWYFVFGARRRSLICFGLGCVAGSVLGLILIINYLFTGLPDDLGILFFWRFADIEKIYHWGALPQVITLHWAVDRMTMDNRYLLGMPWSHQFLAFLAKIFRLDLLYPLFGTGIALAAFSRLRGRLRWSAPTQTTVLLVAILDLALFGYVFGRAQPISFYRYSSFALPIMLAAGVSIYMISTSYITRFVADIGARWLVPGLLVACCAAAAAATYPPHTLQTILWNASRFARGLYSIDLAYSVQDGWPGRLPWGGIYPGARGAYNIVGPHTPIWSMHVHSYCMLPDCDIRTYEAFTMPLDYDKLMFGTPEQGRRVLQKAGINYFLFSRELQLEDTLPLSPLFSPDHIARYLGIRWTDGTTALLTWRGPDTKPFDDSWVADYRKAVRASSTVRAFPITEMKNIYQRLRATPHPWHSFDLPCRRDKKTAMC